MNDDWEDPTWWVALLGVLAIVGVMWAAAVVAYWLTGIPG